jgi:hypothetical protein
MKELLVGFPNGSTISNLLSDRDGLGIHNLLSLQTDDPIRCWYSVMLIDGDEDFRAVPLGIPCKSSATYHVPNHSPSPEA